MHVAGYEPIFDRALRHRHIHRPLSFKCTFLIFKKTLFTLKFTLNCFEKFVNSIVKHDEIQIIVAINLCTIGLKKVFIKPKVWKLFQNFWKFQIQSFYDDTGDMFEVNCNSISRRQRCIISTWYMCFIFYFKCMQDKSLK